MGLTKEQWKEKRLNELYDYVKKHGHKIKDVIYWDTYPICVRDICVLSVAIINDELVFADYDKDKMQFIIRRECKAENKKYLEEVLHDMKQFDKNKP